MRRAGHQNQNYGRGEHQIDSLTGGSLLTPDQLAEKIRAAFEAPGYKPPVLPSVALELVQLTQDPNVPLSKVRGLVQSDPLLAASLLGVAQSAFYSRGNPIASLDDAIARLGLKTIGDLFFQVAMTTRVFRAPGYDAPMRDLRKHSVVCANVSRLVCRRTGFPDDYAFMCGLLHDVGMAAAIILVADVPRGQKAPAFEVISSPVEMVHEAAAVTLGKAWALPADVQFVLSHHHHFEDGGHIHPLAAAICVADSIAARVGAGIGNEINEERVLVAARSLALRDEDIEGLALAGENFISMA